MEASYYKALDLKRCCGFGFSYTNKDRNGVKCAALHPCKPLLTLTER